MSPVTNPSVPGAGTPPPMLAGRDVVIEGWDVVIGRATTVPHMEASLRDVPERP